MLVAVQIRYAWNLQLKSYFLKIISNGTIVLNAMLETNFVGNSPSSLITQEAQGGSAASQIMNENPLFVPDPERIVETQCADKVVDFLQAILDAFNVRV